MKCLALLVLVLLCQEAVSRMRWDFPFQQSLDSDLDALVCSSNTYPRTIIDIHASMERGAELLDGLWSADLEQCSAGCCKMDDCDLALYKNDGASKSGKNCYYIRCGDFRNCVTVEHSAFTSVAFTSQAGGDRTGHRPVAVPSTEAPPPSTTPPPPPPPTTTPPPSEAPPTTSHTPVQPVQHITTPSSVPNRVETISATPSSSKAAGGRTKGNGKTGTGGMNSGGKTKGSSEQSNQGDKQPAPSAGDKGAIQNSNDGCGKYGCDGSGVVAVVVVGVICFVIVLVVVAILLKKVVDDRRKKRFKNVDYLINGMYT